VGSSSVLRAGVRGPASHVLSLHLPLSVLISRILPPPSRAESPHRWWLFPVGSTFLTLSDRSLSEAFTVVYDDGGLVRPDGGTFSVISAVPRTILNEPLHCILEVSRVGPRCGGCQFFYVTTGFVVGLVYHPICIDPVPKSPAGSPRGGFSTSPYWYTNDESMDLDRHHKLLGSCFFCICIRAPRVGLFSSLLVRLLVDVICRRTGSDANGVSPHPSSRFFRLLETKSRSVFPPKDSSTFCRSG